MQLNIWWCPKCNAEGGKSPEETAHKKGLLCTRCESPCFVKESLFKCDFCAVLSSPEKAYIAGWQENSVTVKRGEEGGFMLKPKDVRNKQFCSDNCWESWLRATYGL